VSNCNKVRSQLIDPRVIAASDVFAAVAGEVVEVNGYRPSPADPFQTGPAAS
jgi:hypothetical protein